MRGLRLFEAVGVEIEYMIVDAETLDIKPIADEALAEAAGAGACEYENGGVGWSNELTLHVMEMKTIDPVASLSLAAPEFQENILRLNAILNKRGARLMPSGAHPWMNPASETVLWPHENHHIYETYHRLFNCRRHGYANIQSIHVNLPFCGDHEFGKLHAAIRLVLPVIPAIAASSPVMAGARQPNIDQRMEAYRTNAQQIPLVVNGVIPEAVFESGSYYERILCPLYAAVDKQDPTGTLSNEWVNARGAIPRFDRSAFEIRIADTQESLVMDMAVAAAITAAVRGMVEEVWADSERQKAWMAVEPLQEILNGTIRDGERSVITDGKYLSMFGIDGGEKVTAGEVWSFVLERLSSLRLLEPCFEEPLRVIAKHGPLARRILENLGDGPTLRIEQLREVYRRLCDCLAAGKWFL